MSPQKRQKKIAAGRQRPNAPSNKRPPCNIEQALVKAIQNHQTGNLQQAEKIYEDILAIDPNHAETLHAQAIMTCQRGQHAAAVTLFQKAIHGNPAKAVFHYNLGNALKDLERFDEAVPCYEHALLLNPDYLDALNNLGIVFHSQGRLDEALSAYQKAIQLKPDHAEALSNLANTLHTQGRLQEALLYYQKALEAKEDFPEVYNQLGNIFFKQNKLEAAIGCFRYALRINPTAAEYHFNLAIALKNQGKSEEAIAAYQKVVELEPASATAYNNLGNLLRDRGRLTEAETSLRRALKLNPNYAEACSNLANILQDQGRLSEATTNYRRALDITPDFAEAHSNLLFCLTQNATMDAETLFSEHCQFGAQFEAPFRANSPQLTNSPDPDRTLQIGFVSGDFYRHAVACFIEPILAHLSKYSQLSLHAYSNNAGEDAVTLDIKGHFAHWHLIVGLSDEALAEKIRADGIDILIDLSGHTAKNRLLTFARKPAPVQASWIGYPCTTGLRAMDYYLADRFLLPPARLDNQFTEKIVRLPANAPFLPSKNAPPVNILPAMRNGYITFGSFNRPSKLSPSIISLWSQLLRALPDSRMLLGAIPQDGNVDALIDLFAREHIVQERIIFHPRCSMNDYLGLHQQVDICLDTFPYNGGTTTCHALWMGIPTLTLTGDTLPGRTGAAILEHVGLKDFIASDKDDFVQKGLKWTKDLATLAHLRAELRGRFERSAPVQPALIAAGLERALRIMWQRWGAGQPPESFEVDLEEINSPGQESKT